jgi:transcriptional regulator with XRE-family HTH domain
MLKVDEARGRFFHAARILAGFSMLEISELTSITQPTILEIESGEYYPTCCDLLMRIYNKTIMAVFSEENGLASLTFNFESEE